MVAYEGQIEIFVASISDTGPYKFKVAFECSQVGIKGIMYAAVENGSFLMLTETM